MPSTQIEVIIERIYDYIEDCKPTKFSQSKIIVQKDELLDLIDELKRRTPDEIKRYQKIIANRDTIIKDAENDAAMILEDARKKAEELVSETKIMQNAYSEANDLIQKATAESNRLVSEAKEYKERVRSGILNYSGDILSDLETLLETSRKEFTERTEGLINAIEESSDRLLGSVEEKLATVRENKNDIIEEINLDADEDDGSDDAGEEGQDDEGYTEEYTEEDF